jgi:hypothetical protein
VDPLQVVNGFLTGRLNQSLDFVGCLMHQRARVLQDGLTIEDCFAHASLRLARVGKSIDNAMY